MLPGIDLATASGSCQIAGDFLVKLADLRTALQLGQQLLGLLDQVVSLAAALPWLLGVDQHAAGRALCVSRLSELALQSDL